MDYLRDELTFSSDLGSYHVPWKDHAAIASFRFVSQFLKELRRNRRSRIHTAASGAAEPQDEVVVILIAHVTVVVLFILLCTSHLLRQLLPAAIEY